ncbi:MAG TPA: class I SAM-dependent methyltransferase, partial [Bryobacteraceae bacterium]|nr:class I SAM-dependent methyltransferase [Bryobacteraceae bacterium]
NLTNDFHFDTEIIIKLHHQNFRIVEVPIPTFYGDEICYVNGLKYAKAIVRAVNRYHATARSVRSYPEYQEYFVPYAVKRSLFSCHYFAARLVGTDQRVLEVGCGDGSFGAELARAGNQVVGVDNHPNVPLSAGYTNVLTADLERGLGDAANSGQPYDRILVLDTLEHLRDANALLEDCKKILAARGKMLVSVPNAVNLTVRLMILLGRFHYNERGILDWSHLRFFTAKSIRELLQKHGFHVTARRDTIMPLERVVALRPDSRFLRAANWMLRALTAVAPGLFAYEILLVAEH